MRQEVPTWLAVVIIVAILVVAGFFLYRSVTAGGVQGTGRPGEVQAAPPVPGGGAPPRPTTPPSPSGY